VSRTLFQSPPVHDHNDFVGRVTVAGLG
jgi:hypothetical protein